MYAPIPEDLDDEYSGDTTVLSFNGTRNMERGNRQVRGKNLLALRLISLKLLLNLFAFTLSYLTN
jgi:hypothetical protein